MKTSKSWDSKLISQHTSLHSANCLKVSFTLFTFFSLRSCIWSVRASCRSFKTLKGNREVSFNVHLPSQYFSFLV